MTLPGVRPSCFDPPAVCRANARVSTRDQTVALQLDALHVARCGRVFEETGGACVTRRTLDTAGRRVAQHG